jgi:hypothetical protein
MSADQMQVDNFDPKRFRFSGRAAGLLREGAIASLIRELGDHYAAYHAELAAQVKQWGGQPDPLEYTGDFDRYAADCAAYADVIRSEWLLRRARDFRLRGRAFDLFDSRDEPPLVSDGLLVSVEAG